MSSVNEEHFLTAPTAPPSYEAVDVVQEFARRFDKRKQSIYDMFEKRRLELENKHQAQLLNLLKEQSVAIAQLHASYVEWVNVEPPEYICSVSPNKQYNTPSSSGSKTRWRWLGAFT